MFGAFLEGVRRVLTAPAITLGVAAATFVLAAPLGLALPGMLPEDPDAITIADRVMDGWDAGWAAEFALVNGAASSAVAASVLLWLFVSGGILDRFARARPIRTAAFFAACGVHFLRFLRLGVVIGTAYWALFAWLHPFLFTTLWNRWTGDVTMERDAVVIRAALYVVFLVSLALVSLVSDYAKVRIVVEDRRSVIGALGAALRFVRRRPFRTMGLYLLSALASLAVVGLWYGAVPAATWSVAWAFLVTQVYVLFRIWTRLVWMAAEVVFFQGELAHATYTAAPLPAWPDSPAAEALENLTSRR